MAKPQALAEAGLALEYQDGGTRLIVREADPTGCAIRNRGGEALASLLLEDRKIRILDISESNINDNGVGQVSLVLRQTDQLEELYIGIVGHTGLEFLLGVVRRCKRLSTLRVELADAHTLNGIRQSVTAADHNTSAYAGEKQDEEEEGQEEAEEELDEEEKELEPEERERRRAEKLKAIFRENDYDSADEGVQQAGETEVEMFAEPEDETETAPSEQLQQLQQERKPPSPALSRLLGEFLAAARKRENLTVVDCVGEPVPNDLRLDLSRAMREHVELHERLERRREEIGSRTATDALRDQMEELNKALDEPEAEASADGPPTTRLGMRSYIARRLFAALGKALFEAQRYKSKENEALSTPQGEIAFIAMHLRKHAAKAAAEEAATTQSRRKAK